MFKLHRGEGKKGKIYLFKDSNSEIPDWNGWLLNLAKILLEKIFWWILKFQSQQYFITLFTQIFMFYKYMLYYRWIWCEMYLKHLNQGKKSNADFNITHIICSWQKGAYCTTFLL